tara:strand:+ start:737 stop:1273 length:537 start_codon:yes stop_codon:yes gene_type:complete
MKKSESKKRVSFSAIRGCMDDGLWDLVLHRIAITRHFYEGIGKSKTGWMSLEAMDLIKDGTLPTEDHVLAPQTTAYFICDNWDIYCDFDKYCKIWDIASQTCNVTSEQNRRLRKWTGKTSAVVLCPINERYKRCDIRLYKENTGFNDRVIQEPFNYPFIIPEGYLEYESKTLLLKEGQ